MEAKEHIKQTMRIIEGFPAEGISYKDITPILQDPQVFHETVDALAKALEEQEFDYILGVEARGFIVGAAVAYTLHKGFLMARKPGKLPGNLIKQSYSLEYGEAAVEMDRDTLREGDRVVVMDDLLATGGTAEAACKLVEKAGGKVATTLFLTELTEVGGRKKLEAEGYPVISLLQWSH